MTPFSPENRQAPRIRGPKLLAFLGVYCLLCAPLSSSRIPSVLEKIIDSGEIVMISRNGPTTYFQGREGYVGFEYTLGQAFAEFLGVDFKIVDEEDLGVMLNTLGEQPLRFAGAGLTITPERRHKVHFGPSYLNVTQKLLYRSGTARPRTIEDLYDKRIVVIGNSSHEENLVRLKRDFPLIEWDARSDLEMMDLMELVHRGDIDFTIVDSNTYDLKKTRFPRARAAFDISEPDQLAWAFPKQKDRSLLKKVDTFFSLHSTKALLDETIEAYYGHINELNASDSLVFMSRLRKRLPDWQDLLEQAAAENDLDWHLLAAISYQESHWDPKAVSRTGVRGFMMLTLPAAEEMGVTDRSDAEQSIFGGARYFRTMYDRIPERIQDPDRTWFALAAYNIGYGHLEDARRLTEHFGGDPDRWVDVQEYVLKLSKRKYYKSTRYGYARGWEAVGYVQNIRNFHNILAWHHRELDQQLVLNDQPIHYPEFSPVVSEAVKTLSTPSAEL